MQTVVKDIHAVTSCIPKTQLMPAKQNLMKERVTRKDRIADRAFRGFVVIAINGVATRWSYWRDRDVWLR